MLALSLTPYVETAPYDGGLPSGIFLYGVGIMAVLIFLVTLARVFGSSEK